jgi:hypothetical protein
LKVVATAHSVVGIDKVLTAPILQLTVLLTVDITSLIHACEGASAILQQNKEYRLNHYLGT